MARIKIQVGTRYVYANEIYSVQQVLADHNYRVENASSGKETVISYDELFQAWSGGELRFEIAGSNAIQDTDVS